MVLSLQQILLHKLIIAYRTLFATSKYALECQGIFCEARLGAFGMLNKTFKTIQEFIRLESSGGAVLFAAAVFALILDNSPLSWVYHALLSASFAIHLGPVVLDKSLLHWVDDGLMTIFFFLVGLEIKREIFEGELNTLSKLSLPGIAAIGGMIFPALIYVFINWGHPVNIRGWAIPTATDIAFALGVLAVLGSRIPSTLKVFLTALAILDDIGAILIIAIFYTASLSYLSLALALFGIVGLWLLNSMGVKRLTPYCVVGFILWLCVLKSGIHATLAGVVVAFAIPLAGNARRPHSPLRKMEHYLHPWVAFGVLPLFAFFNAGISFSGMGVESVLHRIPIGIILGLFIGKQLGVFIASWLAVKCKIASLPRGANWLSVYGIALICGIGFTMSLFIGTLAFNGADGNHATMLRLGVMIGSFLSGLLGYLVLRSVGWATRRSSPLNN